MMQASQNRPPPSDSGSSSVALGQHAGPAPAGLPRRLAALAYDLLLLFAIWFCGTLLLLMLRGGDAIAPRTWWFDLALLALGFLFFAGFWTHGGQTLGMRAWRLEVQRLDGGPLRWRDAALRFAGALIGAALLGLGFLSALADPAQRCWHDRLSDTRLVIRSANARKGDERHEQ